MGLFGLLKGSSSGEKPMEYYLKQYDSRTLMLRAKEYFIRVMFGYHEVYGAGAYIQHERTLQYTFFEDREKGIEKMPGSMVKKQKIHVTKLLEIVKDRNDEYSSEAVFYMGLCYEHGLGVQADQDKANEFFHEADLFAKSNNKKGKNLLLEAFRFVKKDMKFWNMYSDSKTEMLILSIYFYINEDDKENNKYEPLRAIFGDNEEEWDEFCRLPIDLMASYANQGYPYSQAMLGITLLNTFNTPYKVCPAHTNALAKLSDEERVYCGKFLIEQCKETARSRGPRAQFAREILTDLSIAY